METVLNLKNRYRVTAPLERGVKPVKDLPSWPGEVIGN
jgi:hypothetical protein